MESREFHDLKDIVDRIEGKVDTMVESLKTCQSRCHVKNPPSGWRKLFRSMTSMVAVIF